MTLFQRRNNVVCPVDSLFLSIMAPMSLALFAMTTIAATAFLNAMLKQVSRFPSLRNNIYIVADRTPCAHAGGPTMDAQRIVATSTHFNAERRMASYRQAHGVVL